MKKKLFLMWALLSMSASMLADGLTATLQQGDEMQAFFGANAFKQAYEAADSGAVITLSAGNFNSVTTIKKSITLIGAYAFDTSTGHARSTFFENNVYIEANNIHLEGIYFGANLYLGAISNCHIKRCKIEKELAANDIHTNTLMDQCITLLSPLAI